MKLQWTNEFSVHVEEIDAQHQELFGIINTLDAIMRQGEGVEGLARVIEFLDRYVATHFETEERIMTSRDYPGYSIHRSRHIWFATEVTRLRRKIEAGGSSPDNIMHANYLLISWFSNHVRTLDRMLGNFLASDVKLCPEPPEGSC